MADAKEQVVEKLVDEILGLMTNTEKVSRLLKVFSEKHEMEKRNLLELERLRNKIVDLEKNFTKISGELGIVAIESAREINEKIENVMKDYEKQILFLEEQVNLLRTALIRLSNELKNRKILT